MAKKLRKMTVVTMVILAVMVLVGCDGEEGNVTPLLKNNAYHSEEELKKLESKIDDDVFWESADRARKLIEKTIERRVGFSISFRVSSSDGEEILLEDLYAVNLTYINDVWRKYLSSEVIRELATAKAVTKAHDEGETVEITGVIIKWEQPAGGLDTEKRVFSVCDLSGDGEWDYVTEGRIYFTNGPIGLKNEEGQHLGIDEIEIRRTKLVEIKEDLTFDGLSKLALKEG